MRVGEQVECLVADALLDGHPTLSVRTSDAISSNHDDASQLGRWT